jgi:predicted nucleic acid-binding protein
MKRIVLDTNVTISALFWRGYPRVIYDLVREGKLRLVRGALTPNQRYSLE